MMIQQLIEYYGAKPQAGFFTWLTGCILGIFPDFLFISPGNRELVLWCLQIVSLLIGSTAGILTIISLLRKFSRKK